MVMFGLAVKKNWEAVDIATTAGTSCSADRNRSVAVVKRRQLTGVSRAYGGDTDELLAVHARFDDIAIRTRATGTWDTVFSIKAAIEDPLRLDADVDADRDGDRE